MKKFWMRYTQWLFPPLLIILSIISGNRYYQDIAVMTFLWAGLTSSWNLSCGYSKRLSLGHGAFFGLGAYTSALLYIQFGITPWIGMIIGALISGACAFVLGRTTLQLKGTFFTLATIAFAEITRILVISARDITGGAMGLLIPFKNSFSDMAFTSKVPYILIAGIYMVALLLISTKMEKSKFGYYLIAIGEDRDAAETLGVNTTNVMVIAFVASAMLTSIGGSIFAHYIAYIEPHSVMGMVETSLQFILIGIIGGLGKAFGPFLGAVILIPLSTILRGQFSRIDGLHGFLYGVIMLLVVLWKPDGIITQVQRLHFRLTHKVKAGENDDNTQNR